MAQCQQIKADGTRCKGTAMPGANWCWNHHPEHAAERRASASRAGKRGGRGRPGSGTRELAEVKAEIRAVTLGVLSGRVERRIGAVVFMGYNTVLKAIEAERRVRETEELTAQLAELEERLEWYRRQQQGGEEWGRGA